MQRTSCLMTRMRVVIAGAGVCGTSAAMQIARRVRRKGGEVILVDPTPPLSKTSQVSTECYRNFFMDRALTPFMQRSIDIIEEMDQMYDSVSLSRRGYHFLSESDRGGEALRRFGELASAYGAGDCREHSSTNTYQPFPRTGWRGCGDGFDLITGSENIQRIHPFVSPRATTLLHVRRAGWLSAQGLGMAYLADAKLGGTTRFIAGVVAGADLSTNREINRVRVATNDGRTLDLECDIFINAAGPWMQVVQDNVLGGAAGRLPLQNEVHSKVIFRDTLEAVPQDTCPFLIWRDSVELEWEDPESLDALDDTDEGGIVNAREWRHLQPGGQHIRPAGNGWVLMLWEHVHRHIRVPDDPPPVNQFLLEAYPELCLMGLRVMVPALNEYTEIGRDTYIDGGYYSITPDARPLIGPYHSPNYLLLGGMNGWGIMASAAAGELIAQYVAEEDLPAYAPCMTVPRFSPRDDPPIDLLDESVSE
eukprot:Sspe_Gene.61451::Locus_34111_Transcript_1_1_Confidence_1.000_Length_1824::g.61451::m.61451